MPLPPSLGPVAAVVISRRRRQIIESFRHVGATTRETAVSLDTAGISRSLLFEIQRLRGVLVPVDDDRFYLDEVRERQVNRFRKIAAALLITGGMITVFAVVLLAR